MMLAWIPVPPWDLSAHLLSMVLPMLLCGVVLCLWAVAVAVVLRRRS